MSNHNTRKKNIALLILIGLLTAAFIMFGGMKLMDAEEIKNNFVNRWGLPLWMVYVTGLFEVAGAILLAIPRSTIYGALLLLGTMVGAILTHLVNGELAAAAFPAVLSALLSVVGYARRVQLHPVLYRFGLASESV